MIRNRFTSRLPLLLPLLLAMVSTLHGQEQGTGPKESEESTKSADPRLQHLQSIAAALKIERRSDPDEPCELSPQPLLRYQNPLYDAQSDGALLMWTCKGMPVAFASYSIRKDSEVWTEFVSVSEKPLSCAKEGRAIWSPSKLGFGPETFSKPPKQTTSERIRLIQMKRLAERISSGDNRLLPSPLHRYASKENGIVDGAVFALVTANDPEVLILIEVYEAEGEDMQYRYKLGRMSSVPRTVELDGREVWDVPGYWVNPRTGRDTYMEGRTSMLPEQLKSKELKDGESSD